jgi:hypothetical protein
MTPSQIGFDQFSLGNDDVPVHCRERDLLQSKLLLIAFPGDNTGQ